jgi:hypothetical protein
MQGPGSDLCGTEPGDRINLKQLCRLFGANLVPGGDVGFTFCYHSGLQVIKRYSGIRKI